MMDLNELIRAASGGDLERAKALLDQHPGLALKRDESGATALHFAALNGHRAIARLLIERDGGFRHFAKHSGLKLA